MSGRRTTECLLRNDSAMIDFTPTKSSDVFRGSIQTSLSTRGKDIWVRCLKASTDSRNETILIFSNKRQNVLQYIQIIIEWKYWDGWWCVGCCCECWWWKSWWWWWHTINTILLVLYNVIFGTNGMYVYIYIILWVWWLVTLYYIWLLLCGEPVGVPVAHKQTRNTVTPNDQQRQLSLSPFSASFWRCLFKVQTHYWYYLHI